jgi:hypothetical protein
MQINSKEERFCLKRFEKRKSFYLFIGLNPSHADDNKGDRTINLIAEYMKELEYGFIVVNLSSQRTPNPKQLEKLKEISFIEDYLKTNHEHIKEIIKSHRIKQIVLFWGNGITKHLYLVKSAIGIKKIIDEMNINIQWSYIDRNKSIPKNPKHFGRMSEINNLKIFSKEDITAYFEYLENKWTKSQ